MSTSAAHNITAMRTDRPPSDIRHIQTDSSAPSGPYRQNGNRSTTSGTSAHAGHTEPEEKDRPLHSMLDRRCKWPFEEDSSHARRIRKKDRPAHIPLRSRHFFGCSSIDQYNLGVKLGQGTFGEVKKATHFLTGAEVALKKVTIHEEKDGMPITAIREIKLLKRLRHPAIIPIIDMAYSAPTERGKVGEVFMVEPYMDHDLNGMLENPSIQLNTSQIKLYMKQLFEGTLYLHQNKILHRDMKAANLLINNKGQLQIADFGLARPYHDPGRAWEAEGWKGGAQSYTGMVVTRWYRPPELLAGERKYGPPIDMWGLGCILAEMIVKHPVFKGCSEIDQMLLIAQLCGSPNEQSYPGWSSLPGVKNADPSGRPDQEPDIPGQHDFGLYPRRVVEHFTGPKYMASGDLADLIDKLLVLDPRQRLTAKQALEHRWFWTAPFPADPNAVPLYQASKELDRQRRDQQKRLSQQQKLPPAPIGKGGSAPYGHQGSAPQPYGMARPHPSGAYIGGTGMANGRPLNPNPAGSGAPYNNTYRGLPSRPPGHYPPYPAGGGGRAYPSHANRSGPPHMSGQSGDQQSIAHPKPDSRYSQSSNPYVDI